MYKIKFVELRDKNIKVYIICTLFLKRFSDCNTYQISLQYILYTDPISVDDHQIYNGGTVDGKDLERLGFCFTV